MTESEVLLKNKMLVFARDHHLGVVATASLDGMPEAALINIAVTAEFEFVFETTNATRKYSNLSENPRAELVIGWQDQRTLQCRALVDEPQGRQGERIKTAYLETFPKSAPHQYWPGNHYFRLQPVWMRLSDYNMPRNISELEISVPDMPQKRSRWRLF